MKLRKGFVLGFISALLFLHVYCYQWMYESIENTFIKAVLFSTILVLSSWTWKRLEQIYSKEFDAKIDWQVSFINVLAIMVSFFLVLVFVGLALIFRSTLFLVLALFPDIQLVTQLQKLGDEIKKGTKDENLRIAG